MVHFQEIWKKEIDLIRKRKETPCVKKYQPVSLLPVIGKIIEKLIYQEIFRFFVENELIGTNQLGLKPQGASVLTNSY